MHTPAKAPRLLEEPRAVKGGLFRGLCYGHHRRFRRRSRRRPLLLDAELRR